MFFHYSHVGGNATDHQDDGYSTSWMMYIAYVLAALVLIGLPIGIYFAVKGNGKSSAEPSSMSS